MVHARDDDLQPAAEGTSRRGLLGGAGLAAVGAGFGASNLGGGPALAQAPAPAAKGPQMLDLPGKDRGLVVLGDRPLVAETPEVLLDDDTTPTRKFYIRNNGLVPEPAANPDAWALTIDGEVERPLKLTLGELKSRFEPVTLRIVLECAGNGRSAFQPPARGNQWTNGGAGCAEWTGVRLRDVLAAAGPRPSAAYTAHYGADPHLSGDATKESLSRGMPVAKALEPHTLLAWGMNGEPLPNLHGGPLRLVVPGWTGSLSHKWLTRIWLRDREHDGAGMLGTSYRVPRKPMIPGAKADEADFEVFTTMPVRSVVTSPANGARLPAGTRELHLRGAAWGGDAGVSKVEVSRDGGATWVEASASAPRNRYDWRRWTAVLPVPTDGYYEVFVRATDGEGRAQPHVATGWNTQGYGGNAMHRVAVLVG